MALPINVNDLIHQRKVERTGKDILVLWIPGGEDRPYKCPEKVYTQKGGEKSPKAYYIRKGARTLKANAREERELIADYLHTVGSDLYDNALNRSVEAVATDIQLVRGPSCPPGGGDGLPSACPACLRRHRLSLKTAACTLL